MKLAERAFKERWRLDPDKKQQLIDRLFEIATDSGSSERDTVAAARALLQAEAQNQADEKVQEAKQSVSLVILKVLQFVPAEHRHVLESAIQQAIESD
jgi:hypothetical protein